MGKLWIGLIGGVLLTAIVVLLGVAALKDERLAATSIDALRAKEALEVSHREQEAKIRENIQLLSDIENKQKDLNSRDRAIAELKKHVSDLEREREGVQASLRASTQLLMACRAQLSPKQSAASSSK